MESDSTNPELLYSNDDQEYHPPDETPKPKRKSSAGRKLMRWSPSKDQLVLLSVEYVASRDGIPLDWNSVAKVVEPSGFLSGEAIKQHLIKLRAAREAAGPNWPVPPKLSRGQIAKKPQQPVAAIPAQKVVPHQQPKNKHELGTEEPEQVSATPQNKVYSALLYQKPMAEPKKINVKAGYENSQPETPTRKRKLELDGDISKKRTLLYNLEDDRVNSMNANFNLVTPTTSGMLNISSPRQDRRVGLTNFPEGDPTPNGSSPFDSPLPDPNVEIDVMGLNLCAQPRINYAGQQIEDINEGYNSSDATPSVTFGQSGGMNFPQGFSSNTPVEENQYSVNTPFFQPPGPGYSGNTFSSQSTGIPLYLQSLVRGMANDKQILDNMQMLDDKQIFGDMQMLDGEQIFDEKQTFDSHDKTDQANPIDGRSADYFMPRSMAREMNEDENTGQICLDMDFGGAPGGTYGSMDGVGLGGETGVFQMGPSINRVDLAKVKYFSDSFGDDAEMKFELYGDEAKRADGCFL